MTDDAPSALGPLFGPDFILVTADDANKVSYQLEIFPDGNNSLLKSNGIAQQFYFMPQRIYLAKKQDSPQDFDFGMTVFKGLLTSEDTVGVNPGQGTGGGDVEVGGGFCTFSTTFAIPPEVLQNATDALKNGKFDSPPPGGSTAAPLWAQAQSAKKGSIEATGISSFLVSCNELAAGAIAGSLKAGVSPFTVNYALTEQFYLPACEVDVDIDMDKVYDSFSVGVTASGFFTSASFQGAWSATVTSGATTPAI